MKFAWYTLIIALLGCGTEKPPASAYQEGMRIMEQSGVADGLAFFESREVTDETLFGTGWIFFVKGEYSKAEKIANYLLEERSGITSAHANYLMGYLQIRYSKPLEGKGYFEDALKEYRRGKSDKDIYKTTLGIIKCNIMLLELDLARNGLATAFEISKGTTVNLAPYFDLLGELQFKSGEHQSAIETRKLSLEIYKKKGDVPRTAMTMIELSFYTLRSGDYESGLIQAEKAQEFIQLNDLASLSYSNTLNYILAYRCSGQPFDNESKAIEGYVASTKDKYTQEMLDYVLTCDCSF